MVFGRRTAKPCIRPAPPGVEHILADLEATDSKDPVFALSTDLLSDWLETTSTSSKTSDPNVLYNKVTEYINSKGKLENLEKQVVQGTESLEKSLVDLKDLAREVQANLEKVRDQSSGCQAEKERGKPGVAEKAEDSSSSDQENLC
jgi:hypothetical protein